MHLCDAAMNHKAVYEALEANKTKASIFFRSYINAVVIQKVNMSINNAMTIPHNMLM